MYKLHKKLKCIKWKLKGWKKKTKFGNILEEEYKLEHKMEGIQQEAILYGS